MLTPDLNSIRPCSVKMCGSRKFYNVNVEKLAANSALQLQRRKYKIAYKALYTLGLYISRPENIVLHQVNS